MQIRTRLKLILMLLLLGVLIDSAGCRQADEIVVHRVPKDRSGLEALQGSDTQPDRLDGARQTEDRMIVGMFEQPKSTWFFKIAGPVDQVTKTQTQWKPFLESVTFANGEPTWDLPADWSTGPPVAMRKATLKFGDFDPPLELAISGLGPNQDRLLNVNRWRGQMGLDKISADELEASLTPLKSAAPPALLFDVTGKSAGNTMAPFANRGANLGQRTPTLVPPEKNQSADPRIKFSAREGWETGKTSGMVPVRLMKAVDDATVQITAVQMPASANKWTPNAKRWAGEVGLKLTPEELDARTSEIEVDGTTGRLLNLASESDRDEGTLAVMIKRDDTAWFLKLKGDRELVLNNETEFLELLKTIRFAD